MNLREELKNWIAHTLKDTSLDARCAAREVKSILGRHPEEKPESLAELADRKGFRIDKIVNHGYPAGWLIHLTPKAIIGAEPIWQRYDKTIEIPIEDNVYTYPEAESAARAYLEKMEDVK